LPSGQAVHAHSPPYSVDFEFLALIDRYRGIIEEAVFDRLGRPSFFDGAVEVVMMRTKARVEQRNLQATANRESPSCAFAPQLRVIRKLAQEEAFWLRRETERRFVRSGRLGLL
jgi:hypothetical protein